jgi:hypothetical protein
MRASCLPASTLCARRIILDLFGGMTITDDIA